MSHEPLTQEPAPDDRALGDLEQQAQAAFDRGDWAAAIAACRRWIAEEPERPDGYRAMGLVLVASDKREAAIAAWQRAIALDPQDCDLWVRLAKLHGERGQGAAAIAAYDRAIALAPHRPDLHLAWLRSAIELGQDAWAIEQLAALYRSHPLTIDEAVMRGLADRWLVLERGRSILTVTITALQAEPRLWLFYGLLGHVLQAFDRHREATDCFNRAIPATVVRDFSPHTPFCEIIAAAHPAVRLEPIALETQARGVIVPPPQTIGPNDHPTWRNDRADDLNPYLAWIEGGRAWGDWSNTVVMAPDGRLLEDLSGHSAALIASSKTLPPCESLPGTVAFLPIAGGTNYFHWMIDFLPRFELLQRSAGGLAGIDRFVVFSRSLAPFQRNTLDWLGIPADKTIESAWQPHLQADRLVVPSIACRYGNWKPPRWGCHFLRDRFAGLGDRAAADWGSDRIYISRRDANYRRVANEEALLAVLEPLGFQTVVLSGLTLAEQIALFQRAKVIVAPHGAGLINLVFCAPETCVIELFSPKSVPGLFWVISHYMQLRYGYLLGADPEALGLSIEQSRAVANHEDIWVEVAALVQLLDRLGALA